MRTAAEQTSKAGNTEDCALPKDREETETKEHPPKKNNSRVSN